MNKIININKYDEPALKTIRMEAGIWVARIGNARPDEDTARELHQWLERSPLHRREFKKLAMVWVNLDDATGSALADIITGLEERGAAVSVTRRTVFAGLVLVVGLVSMLFIWNPGLDYFRQPAAYMAEYQTAIGETRLIDLPDQSTMQLNTRTRATVHYTGKTRTIQLAEGEAQFEVSHDPDRPFIVYAGRHAVRAVGTAFAVYLTEEGSVDVIVSSGRIQVATFTDTAVRDSADWDDPDNNRHIKNLMSFDAGHHAVFKHEIELVERIEADDIEKRLSWRNNIIAFNGDKLEDVVRELGRYTPKKFIILDDELRNFRVGAYFRAGDIVSILDTFDTGLGIHVQQAGENTVYLTKKR